MYKPSIRNWRKAIIETLTANILFSGIGAQERGFNNSGLFNINVITTADINKEAVVSYAAIHCGLTQNLINTYENYPSRQEMAEHLTEINLGYNSEKNKYYDWLKLTRRKKNDIEKYWLACKLTNNKGDISRIKELPYADLWTISFCCQDTSVAGKMKGLKPDSGTRSSLLWNNIDLLYKSKEKGELPKYILFENVKNLVSKKFIDDFNDLLSVMDELGFNSYWKVLNAKDCGIAQNRERVFVICIRKDIDTKTFNFPKPFDNGLRLIDFLEDEVDEKYYLSKEVLKKFKFYPEFKGEHIKVIGSLNPDKNVQDKVRILDINGISQGLRATDYKDPVKIAIGIDKSINSTKQIDFANCITSRENRGVSNRKSEGTAVLEQIGQIYGTETEPNPQAGRIYDAEYLSPTLDTCKGGNRMPKIIESNHSKWKQKMYNKFITDSNGEISGAYTNQSEKFEYSPPMKELSKTLKANANNAGVVKKRRIRKLTPKECYRLMGFNDTDIDNAYAMGVSDSQLYSQAGNSIVTNCVKLLAEHLYKAQYDDTYICSDENFIQPQVD